MGISSTGPGWMPPHVASAVPGGSKDAATPYVKGLGIPALHTERVGDKDVVPTPPEPPAEASKDMAVTALEDTAQTQASRDGAEPDPMAGTEPAPSELSTLLRDVNEGPVNPTVDLRK